MVKNQFIILLLILITALFICVQITDSNQLKYGIILLCFAIGLLSTPSFDSYWLRFAIALTLVSDFCMLFLNQFVVGIAVFCLVQACYCMRHSNCDVRLIYALAAFWLVGLLTLAFTSYNVLLVAAFVYAPCLLLSVCVAVFGYVRLRTRKNLLIAIGMLLFLCCDICVALYNLTGVAQKLIWVFYAPSQVLLALSSHINSTEESHAINQ